MCKVNLKINNIFWNKYKFFYIFNSCIKFFRFLYFIIIYLDFGFLLENDSFENDIHKLAKSIKPIYVVFLLFLNNVVIDFGN